jgi:hypothetical protein
LFILYLLAKIWRQTNSPAKYNSLGCKSARVIKLVVTAPKRGAIEMKPIQVTLEAENGQSMQVFVGPDAGGMKVVQGETECVVVTPEAPLGRALLGKVCDDEIEVGQGGNCKAYTIVAVA